MSEFGAYRLDSRLEPSFLRWTSTTRLQVNPRAAAQYVAQQRRK